MFGRKELLRRIVKPTSHSVTGSSVLLLGNSGVGTLLHSTFQLRFCSTGTENFNSQATNNNVSPTTSVTCSNDLPPTESSPEDIIHRAIELVLIKKKSERAGIQLPVLASNLPEDILESLDEGVKAFLERHPDKYYIRKATSNLSLVSLKKYASLNDPVVAKVRSDSGPKLSVSNVPDFAPPPPPPKPSKTDLEAAKIETQISIKSQALTNERTTAMTGMTVLPNAKKKNPVLAERNVQLLQLPVKELNTMTRKLIAVSQGKKILLGLRVLTPIVDEAFFDVTQTSSLQQTSNKVARDAIEIVVQHSMPTFTRSKSNPNAPMIATGGTQPLLHFVAVRKNWEKIIANSSAIQSLQGTNEIFKSALDFSCLQDLPSVSPVTAKSSALSSSLGNATTLTTFESFETIDSNAFNTSNGVSVISGTQLLHNVIADGKIDLSQYNIYATIAPQYEYLVLDEAVNIAQSQLEEGYQAVQKKIIEYQSSNSVSSYQKQLDHLLSLPKFNKPVEDYDCFRVARFVSAETFTPLAELKEKAKEVTQCDLMHVLLSAPHLFEFDHQPKTVPSKVAELKQGSPSTQKHNYDDPYAEYIPSSMSATNQPLDSPSTEKIYCTPSYASPSVTSVRFKVHEKYLFEDYLGFSDSELAEKELDFDERLYRGGKSLPNHMKINYKRNKKIIQMMRGRIGKPIESFYDVEILAYLLYDSMGEEMIKTTDLTAFLGSDIVSRTTPSHVPFLKQFPQLFRFYEIPHKTPLILRADIKGPELPSDTLTEESLMQTIQSMVYKNPNGEVSITVLQLQLPHFVHDKVKSLGFRDLKAYLLTLSDRKEGFSVSKKYRDGVAGDLNYDYMIRNLENDLTVSNSDALDQSDQNSHFGDQRESVMEVSRACSPNPATSSTKDVSPTNGDNHKHPMDKNSNKNEHHHFTNLGGSRPNTKGRNIEGDRNFMFEENNSNVHSRFYDRGGHSTNPHRSGGGGNARRDQRHFHSSNNYNNNNYYNNYQQNNRSQQQLPHHHQQNNPRQHLQQAQAPQINNGFQGGWNTSKRAPKNDNIIANDTKGATHSSVDRDQKRNTKVSGASPLESLVHDNKRPYTHKL